MLEPTPINRATVNDVIAKAEGHRVFDPKWYREVGDIPDGALIRELDLLEQISRADGVEYEIVDYSRDANACFNVCNRREWHVNIS